MINKIVFFYKKIAFRYLFIITKISEQNYVLLRQLQAF